MTLIALVRHGETDWNRAGRVQGHSDIPLNDTGRAQAAAAGEALRGGEYTHLFASPLARAKETAEIIGRTIGLGDPQLRGGLRERNYGAAEGLLVADFWQRFPGGRDVPDAETVDDLRERAFATLEEIADVAGDGPVVAVAHGGLIGQILRHITDGELPRPDERIGNGSQQIIELTSAGARVIGYHGSPR